MFPLSLVSNREPRKKKADVEGKPRARPSTVFLSPFTHFPIGSWWPHAQNLLEYIPGLHIGTVCGPLCSGSSQFECCQLAPILFFFLSLRSGRARPKNAGLIRASKQQLYYESGKSRKKRKRGTCENSHVLDSRVRSSPPARRVSIC